MSGFLVRLSVLVALLVVSVAIVSAGPEAICRILALEQPAGDATADRVLAALVQSNLEVKRVMAVVRSSTPSDANTKGLATLIVMESRKAGVDPLFVTAVVKSESAFRSAVRSKRDARGLMQITPITEQEVKSKVDMSGVKSVSLNNPRYNLRLGINYLKQLESKFKGDRVLALVAYNWGPAHVLQALAGKKQIPGASLSYAAKILENHGRWLEVG